MKLGQDRREKRKKIFRSWRNGLVFKSTYWSCKGFGFRPGDLCFLLNFKVPVHAWYTSTHAGSHTHIHIKKRIHQSISYCKQFQNVPTRNWVFSSKCEKTSTSTKVYGRDFRGPRRLREAASISGWGIVVIHGFAPSPGEAGVGRFLWV